MCKEYLVGYTGFVGSNLANSHTFTGLYNSANISDAYGGNPDLLVYSGVRAEMFLANSNPAADMQHIQDAIENIKRINPKEIVLISSVAVYSNTTMQDEDCTIDKSCLTAYGLNRLALEEWVEENIPKHLIIRLPAIYGKNLKKNFLYDYIHLIPAMLTEKKINELSQVFPDIYQYYNKLDNGFWKCRILTDTEGETLKAFFKQYGFTALNFTDSRSVYQFYSLKRLWTDILTARNNNITKLNLVPPPISVADVYYALCQKTFHNELAKQPFNYNLFTKHAPCFSTDPHYIMSKEQALKDISDFIREEM